MSRRLRCEVTANADGTTTVRAPSVGEWRRAPAVGAFIGGGGTVGQLVVLGQPYDLVAPPEATGFVSECPGARAVSYGDVLLVLDQSHAPVGERAADGAAVGTPQGLCLRTRSSGRFYSRPSPGDPAFVQPGDEIATGQSIGLLEVMKTFSRITYGGDDLPDRAIVRAVRPNDGDDLQAGDVILELEDASGD